MPTARIPIIHNVALRHDTLVRIYFNDLPLFEGTERGPTSQNGGISHMLVPGRNELRLEILRAPLPGPGARIRRDPNAERGVDLSQSISLRIFRPQSFGSNQIEMIHECSFPDVWDGVPERLRRLPYHHVDSFDPGVELSELAFVTAPQNSFPCQGNAELHDAVRRVHEAFAHGDEATVLALLSLQMAEIDKAYGGQPTSSLADQQEAWRELFAAPITVAPLEPHQLHFTPRAGGRVAHVTRLNGKPVIDAHVPDAGLIHRTDLLLIRKDTGWQLI